MILNYMFYTGQLLEIGIKNQFIYTFVFQNFQHFFFVDSRSLIFFLIVKSEATVFCSTLKYLN